MTLLDTSALLAMLKNEPGADRVATIVAAGGAAMSAANVAEALSILTVHGNLTHEDARETIQELGIKTVNVTEEIAANSARIAARYPRSGLSLGDRLCIATGTIYKCSVLSADHAWFTLSLDADIEAVR